MSVLYMFPPLVCRIEYVALEIPHDIPKMHMTFTKFLQNTDWQ